MTFRRIVGYVTAAALLGIGSLAGCGGDDGSPSSTGAGEGGRGAGGDGEAVVRELCQAVSNRAETCGAPSQDVDKCVMDAKCVEAEARDGVVAKVYQCMANQPCTGVDCFSKIAEMEADTSSSIAYKDACMAKSVSCQIAGIHSFNSYCVSFDFTLYKDNYLDDIRSCFEIESCEDASTCVNTKLDERGCY
jgi:hypothetical protein